MPLNIVSLEDQTSIIKSSNMATALVLSSYPGNEYCSGEQIQMPGRESERDRQNRNMRAYTQKREGKRERESDSERQRYRDIQKQ